MLCPFAFLTRPLESFLSNDLDLHYEMALGLVESERVRVLSRPSEWPRYHTSQFVPWSVAGRRRNGFRFSKAIGVGVKVSARTNRTFGLPPFLQQLLCCQFVICGEQSQHPTSIHSVADVRPAQASTVQSPTIESSGQCRTDRLDQQDYPGAGFPWRLRSWLPCSLYPSHLLLLSFSHPPLAMLDFAKVSEKKRSQAEFAGCAVFRKQRAAVRYPLRKPLTIRYPQPSHRALHCTAYPDRCKAYGSCIDRRRMMKCVVISIPSDAWLWWQCA